MKHYKKSPSHTFYQIESGCIRILRLNFVIRSSSTSSSAISFNALRNKLMEASSFYFCNNNISDPLCCGTSCDFNSRIFGLGDFLPWSCMTFSFRYSENSKSAKLDLLDSRLYPCWASFCKSEVRGPESLLTTLDLENIFGFSGHNPEICKLLLSRDSGVGVCLNGSNNFIGVS